MPPPRIESAIRQSIAKLSGEIYARELEPITTLDVTDEGISTLEGIQACTNLRRLYLRDNAISDLTPLSGLAQLTHLDHRSNRIEEIAPLLELQDLVWLQLGGNPLVVTPGSPAREIIDTLDARGVDISS